eukprot:3035029-Amphidinium_carterae.1
MIDSLWRALLDGAAQDALTPSHLNLVAFELAGAWLTAPPSEDKGIPSPLFQVALLTRLRQP